jgi:Ca-activated chloride channel family protein
MVRRTALSVLVGGLLVPRLRAQNDFTIRTTSRLVLLDVSVKDSKGGFAAGLTKDCFRVYEDGRPQEITEFANADIPVTVGILVDTSGSMRSKRTEVITAALAFITASNPQDEVFVLNFNEKIYAGLPKAVPFSDDVELLKKALHLTPAEGRTALYDAVLDGLHHLEQGRRDKKTLVLISDGGDNVSLHTSKQMEMAVLNDIVTIYTIGIFDPDDPERNPGVLRKLSQISGGEAYFPSQLDGILPICEHIAKDIRTRYTIGYKPSTDNGKGIRTVKVLVSAPERGRFTTRTRNRYVFEEEGAKT